MRRDIKRVTLECEAFDADRRLNLSACALQERVSVRQPFEMFYIDIFGGQGALALRGPNKYILPIIDSFTGLAEALLMAN